MAHEKEWRKFLDQIARKGWRLSYTRKGHIRAEGPNGALLFCSPGPSDVRALRNFRADVARAERSP